MRIQDAIYATHPNVKSIHGEDAFDENGNSVSYDISVAQAYANQNLYKEQRFAEYPPITDYLDGVVKGDQAQIDKYIADCQAVKAKYPKG
jgi:hypothetical protein